MVKRGDIALLSVKGVRTLIEIMVLKTKVVTEKVKVGGPFWNRKYEDRSTVQISEIWWRNLGDDSGIVESSRLSPFYDWDRMVNEGELIYKQAQKPRYYNKEGDHDLET